MKAIFQKLGLVLSGLLGIFFTFLWPLLIVVGVISLAFTNTQTFLYILAYIAGIAAFVWTCFFLLTNKKTAPIAKPIFTILLVVFLVKACMSQSGSSGCTPTRYIDCD
jgi:hypothetical protein